MIPSSAVLTYRIIQYGTGSSAACFGGAGLFLFFLLTSVIFNHWYEWRRHALSVLVVNSITFRGGKVIFCNGTDWNCWQEVILTENTEI